MAQGIGWGRLAEEENHHQIVSTGEETAKEEKLQNPEEEEPFEAENRSCKGVEASTVEIVVAAMGLLDYLLPYFSHDLSPSLTCCRSQLLERKRDLAKNSRGGDLRQTGNAG
jgi:hypothetical protein